jgi:hypothetical protein
VPDVRQQKCGVLHILEFLFAHAQSWFSSPKLKTFSADLTSRLLIRRWLSPFCRC